MPKIFYIFRHGETFATKLEKGYGRKVFSAPLLDEGHPAIERIGEYLKNIETDFNTSSNVKRCRQTVEIVSQISGKQFIFDKRLNEFFLETYWHFRRRIKGVLKDIDQKGFSSVCICTHGACIAMLVK